MGVLEVPLLLPSWIAFDTGAPNLPLLVKHDHPKHLNE